MRRSDLRVLRVSAKLLTALALLSCREAPPTAPRGLEAIQLGKASISAPALVISQIYGGGGNAGATYKNDFIEIFNPGSAAVSVAGWSVQYASAAGTSWAATALTGTIPAGGYLLVQEAAGGAGTTALPTADVIGTINMSASAGKIVLASQAAAFAATSCPSGATLVDIVSFGTGNCGTPAPAPASGNLQSDQRNDSGCAYTGDPSADFASAPALPRNSGSAVHTCGVVVVPNPVVTVTIAPDSTGVLSGSTVTFAATGKDASDAPTTTTFTWTSSVPAVATVDANGIATGVADGLTIITATSANGIAGTAKLSVTTPATVTPHAGDIVISQIYGGGGNAGATLKNDFVELFNRSTSPVTVTGWSVQYGSAAGAFTQATPLTGTIPAGGYFLVSEAAGAAGTVDLPTADVVGAINMSGTAGKILLIQSVTPAGVTCPTGTAVVDQVSFGSGTNCGSFTGTLSATLSAQRRSNGCFYTPNAATDFNTAAPAPRNSASPSHSCVVGPLDHVAIGGALTVLAGTTTQLTATSLDANDNIVQGATVTWATSDPTIATVSATGLVTGVAANATPAVITVTSVSGAITKTATASVQVNNDGINWIDVSSSSASFPSGFQTQVFFTARVQSGGTIIPANFTFEAVDPQYMTVANVAGTALVTGVLAPTDGTKPGIKVTATPTAGGTPYVFITRPITIEVPVAAAASNYANNDEFGDPTAASTSNPNDFLIRRQQYVISYNQSRGTPNWVSYELDDRQLVSGVDRCNCFTGDPLLPSDKQIFTSDYTNGGFDRGHMTRSADRTLTNQENAFTYMLSNVVPQQADLNQGVWAQFEDALADSARAGRAVYIITGPLYSRSHGLTFVKGEGKVAIPDSTWKVALIGPGNSGNPFTQANVHSFDDLSGLTLLAVNMPNISGVRNDPWAMYLTTVDKLEAATGYDFLSLLQTGFQPALDYKDHAPVAHAVVTGGTTEGSVITFDASTSTDADIGRSDLGGRTEALTYAWHFSDGTDEAGKIVTKTFAGHGTFTATLTVTDVFGWPNSTPSTITLSDIAPTALFNAPASGTEGSAFSLALTGGTDPSPSDAAALRYAFDCGTGYGAASATSTVSCTPADNGDITVHGKVIDPDGAFTEYNALVHVANVAPTATFTAPASVVQNTGIALSFSNVVDPSSADVAAGFTYAFNCGAGYSDAGPTATATCPAAAAGTVTVHGQVFDKDGGSTEYTATVTVTPAYVPVITAIVRHAPTMNARLDGSLQMLTGENVTFNGGSAVTGKLYVPGLPTVKLNGNPSLGSIADGTGSSTPTGYQLTMNGNTTLGTLVRRTDPVAMPVVDAPVAPSGTRSVSLNRATDPIGDWSTVKNLTLNGAIGSLAVPAGAYGDITVNGSNVIVLGVAGATTPSVYDLQHLTLNGSSSVKVVGPVIITVGNAVSLNGPVNAGGNSDWLTFRVASGGFTMNGTIAVAGTVIVPNGTVTVNGGSTITGALASDRLVLNGSALVKITTAVPMP